jgi:hypothetical protein
MPYPKAFCAGPMIGPACNSRVTFATILTAEVQSRPSIRGEIVCKPIASRSFSAGLERRLALAGLKPDTKF